MLHSPRTGLIPADARKKDMQLLRRIEERQNRAGFRTTINNTYISAGPSQQGGRGRGMAFDMRNNGVVLAAGISGGIFRSADGGATWSFVHPANMVRNVSCLAQDPRPGFQDTWYAGTGELWGASPSYPNAFVPGYGIFKSTDNGLTWSKLQSTIAFSDQHTLDDIFDIVFNIQVDNNGRVYAAVLNYILRSDDGGNNWGFVLGSNNFPPTIDRMATDILIARSGTSQRYYAAVTGRNNSRGLVGVWTSTNGTNFTRIAGGTTLGVDSVAGWRAYDNRISNGSYTAGWGRIVMAAAPSNNNILYVMVANALSAADNNSEADLFRADLSTSPITWSANRGPNLRATRIFQSSTTTEFLETQDEYNMMLAVHPTNPNLVLAGGVNLFRSTDGFSTTSNNRFIGGDPSTTYSDPNFFSHVDFHSFAFDPANPNRLVVLNDGGMQVTNDITATSVAWNNFNNRFQTLQYYHVSIDPANGSLVFAGGAQDNSTSYRDAKGLLAPPLPDPDDHYTLIGGDGGATGLSASSSTQQFLYGSVQEGDVYRLNINRTNPGITLISPAGAAGSEFITYFKLDPYNTETLYYASFNTIWRTNNASTCDPNNGWTNLTGIQNSVTGSIFSIGLSHGTYSAANSYLYFGTDNGKIYRLQNPRNTAASTAPVDISPVNGMTSESLVRAIAVNPRNPDTVLAVVPNYDAVSAFWTGNATSTAPVWHVVEGNIAEASFRSCAIVTTTNGVEYYVGTSIGLFSTTNIQGNNTVWNLEGPAAMRGALINDLDLRTTDNTLLVGTHGNGMFYANIGNVPTSVRNVELNNRNFITSVFPTVATTELKYQTGSLTGIGAIDITIRGMNGQAVWQGTRPYSTGSIPLDRLANGTYVLEIVSKNRKYKHVLQFVKTR
ncbi:MAG: WD40/YVTN/BNR-like repeat-containing protein [Lacibacter sp.]